MLLAAFYSAPWEICLCEQAFALLFEVRGQQGSKRWRCVRTRLITACEALFFVLCGTKNPRKAAPRVGLLRFDASPEASVLSCWTAESKAAGGLLASKDTSFILFFAVQPGPVAVTSD